MALSLKLRPAWTSLDGGGGCCKWTGTILSILTLTTAFLFLVGRIYSRKENPFETSGDPHSIQEIDFCEINPQASAFPRSAAEMSSDGSNRRAQGVSPLHNDIRISETDSIRNSEEPIRMKADEGESSVKHVKRLRYLSLLRIAPNSTHTNSEQSMLIDMSSTISHLLNDFRQRYKTTYLSQRRKLRLDNLSERRKAQLTLDKRTNLDEHSLSKSPINRPTKNLSAGRPCFLNSYPLCQAASMQSTRREKRSKRSTNETNEEDVQKLKNFFIRLLEASMDAEERIARNLTDVSLDALLKEETESNHTQIADEINVNQTGIKTEFNQTDEEKNINQTRIGLKIESNHTAGDKSINQTGIKTRSNHTAKENNVNQTRIKTQSNHTADEKNTSQTGIEKNTEEQKNETLVAKETNTGKSATGEIIGTNDTRKNEGVKAPAEVGESVLGAANGDGFSSGQIGGAGNGKLIISAQIMNGSESRELGQIVINSKNLMEVAIKVTNTSGNASGEQRQWVVELNGEQKMFVAAVIAIASIVAIGTLVFACVWCLYDHEGLCMGVFPCLKPPKDNFSPQRWWMETLARRVENLEAQPFLGTEKYKRTSISQKYHTSKEEGRLSQMVSRLSERMSKSGHSMTKKEQMARNSQMARASEIARASEEIRNSQTENDSDMAKDIKAVRESVQKKDNERKSAAETQ